MTKVSKRFFCLVRNSLVRSFCNYKSANFLSMHSTNRKSANRSFYIIKPKTANPKIAYIVPVCQPQFRRFLEHKLSTLQRKGKSILSHNSLNRTLSQKLSRKYSYQFEIHVEHFKQIVVRSKILQTNFFSLQFPHVGKIPAWD